MSGRSEGGLNTKSVVYDLRLTKAHFSNKVLQPYFRYIQRFGADISVENVCQEAGLSYRYVSDESNWISILFYERFIRILKERLSVPRLCYEIGAMSASEGELGRFIQELPARSILVSLLFRELPRIVEPYTSLLKIKIMSMQGNQVHYRLKIIDRNLDSDEKEALFSAMPHLLESISGFIEALPSPSPAKTLVKRTEGSDHKSSYDIVARYSNINWWSALLIIGAPLGLGLLAGVAVTNVFGISMLVSFLVGSLISLLCWLVGTLYCVYSFFLVLRKTATAFQKLYQRYEDLRRAKHPLEEDFLKMKEQQRMIDEQRAQIISASKWSALGEMVGGIAHEINNPLSALKNRVSALTIKAQNNSLEPVDVQNRLSQIEKTVDRIATIIQGHRDLVMSQRKDTSGRYLLKQIIEDAVELSQVSKPGNRICLKMGDVPEGLELECRGVQISQVLVNLLNNACEAVNHLPDGSISVEFFDFEDRVELAVLDNGQGVPDNMKKYLFEPFKSSKEGAGIGLGISRRIMKSHGGDLYWDHKSSKTRFVAVLPKSIIKTTGLEASSVVEGYESF